MSVKVKALEAGFDGISLRLPGEIFDWDKGELAPWTEEVKSESETKILAKETKKAEAGKRKNELEIE